MSFSKSTIVYGSRQFAAVSFINSCISPTLFQIFAVLKLNYTVARAEISTPACLSLSYTEFAALRRSVTELYNFLTINTETNFGVSK